MFWMPALLALIMIRRGSNPAKWWIILGITSGVGLLNKPSMVFFLVALCIALLLTPQRRLLFSRYAALGIAIMVIIALPNLLWQIHNHWPTLEFLHNGRIRNKNIHLAPLAFILQQIMTLGPGLPLSGSQVLSTSCAIRTAAISACLPNLPRLHDCDGGKGLLRYPYLPHSLRRRWHRLERRFAPAVSSVKTCPGLSHCHCNLPSFDRHHSSILQPSPTPADLSHLSQCNPSSIRELRERIKWPTPTVLRRPFRLNEELEAVTRVVNALSVEDRAKAGILAANYGEASSLLILGKDRNLPPVISGHNSYWLWGPQQVTGEVMIVINGATLSEMREVYEDVQIAGRMDHRLSMPFEHRNIYLAVTAKRASPQTGTS